MIFHFASAAHLWQVTDKISCTLIQAVLYRLFHPDLFVLTAELFCSAFVLVRFKPSIRTETSGTYLPTEGQHPMVTADMALHG